MKTAIVSGANKNYFDHLLALCKSLKKNKIIDNLNDVSICIFNIDFTDDQIIKLQEYSKNIISPKWDFKLKFKTQEWKKLLTARPFLIDYFPNFENYIWLDADTIVLDKNFVNFFSKSLVRNDLNIIPELDASYINETLENSFKNVLKNFYVAKGWVYKNNLKYFGKKHAIKLLNKPLFNAGVYSLKKDSKIWDLWKEDYQKIVEKSNNDYCLNMDQASLNKIIYENIELVNIFNAKFNWLAKNSLPLIDDKFQLYTSSLPNEKISILHLTQIDKNKLFKFYNIEKNTYLESTFEKILKEILQ